MTTRRRFLQGAAALAAHSALAAGSTANHDVAYGTDTLPRGVRSRFVDTNNGVTLHVLEAGYATRGIPCVVLVHGFPELAYTWRNQLLPIAAAGYHVIAPDLRGYGRSARAPVAFDDDLLPYLPESRVSDVLGLARALGYERVAAIVGHDWGGPLAAWCALRPDVFRSVVWMSTPYAGTSALRLDTADHPRTGPSERDIQKDLAALPVPRKHYWWYYASAAANPDMWHPPQGVHDLLRAMYYYKSADWGGNRPFPLKAWRAEDLAKLPTYYVMNLGDTVAATMAAHMPSAAEVARCRWMSEQDLDVYAGEYSRTGFQGGLNAYRIMLEPRFGHALDIAGGRIIEVPASFIGGARDWGVRQTPGNFEAMQHGACRQLVGVHLVEGAGHSLAEEQPAQVNRLLLDFLDEARSRA